MTRYANRIVNIPWNQLSEAGYTTNDTHRRIDAACVETIKNVERQPLYDGADAAYTFPSTAEQYSIVSDSALDTSGGTGVQSVMVYGLNALYISISEEVTLNGTTPVTTTNSYLRFSEVRSEDVGSTGYNAGNITVTGGTTGGVYGVIPPYIGKTRSGVYTVPLTKRAIVSNIFVNLYRDSKNGFFRIKFYERESGKAWNQFASLGLSSQFHAGQTLEVPLEFFIEPGTDLQILYDSSNNRNGLQTFVFLLEEDLDIDF